MTVRLDIGGPKGNAFYILGTVPKLGKQFGLSPEEIEEIRAEMTGKIINALGGYTNYEHLLSVYLKYFPIVELYADSDLGIDSSLYTIVQNEIYEL